MTIKTFLNLCILEGGDKLRENENISTKEKILNTILELIKDEGLERYPLKKTFIK